MCVYHLIVEFNKLKMYHIIVCNPFEMYKSIVTWNGISYNGTLNYLFHSMFNNTIWRFKLCQFHAIHFSLHFIRNIYRGICVRLILLKGDISNATRCNVNSSGNNFQSRKYTLRSVSFSPSIKSSSQHDIFLLTTNSAAAQTDTYAKR